MGTQRKKIESIQALRVFAALTVSLYHIRFVSSAWNMDFGVDIFMTITGFLAMYTTGARESLDVKAFVASKAIRLFPLYYALTVGAFLIASVFPALLNGAPTAAELVKSLLFLPYSRIGMADGLAVVRPIVGPAHTLMYNVYFYFLFVIASKVSFRHRGLLTSGLLISVVLAGLLLPGAESAMLTFYSKTCVLNFVWGIVLFYIVSREKGAAKSSAPARAGYLLICALCLIWLFYNSAAPIPGVTYIFKKSVPSAILVLAAMKGLEGISMPRLVNSLAKVSYSYYLLHYFVILFVSKMIVSLDTFHAGSCLAAGISLLVSLGLAWVSWYVFENRLAAFLKGKLAFLFAGKAA